MHKLYPLPTFPPYLAVTFYHMCKFLTANQVHILREKVEDLETRLRSHAREAHAQVDLETVEELTGACRIVLEYYEQLSEHDRALAVGAVSYFLFENDSVPDFRPNVGLKEDVQVMNYVLEELGLSAISKLPANNI